MRIVLNNGTRRTLLGLSGRQCYTARDVETMLQSFVSEDSTVDAICLDFCGEYIPVTHASELRIVSRLVAVYHNSMIDASWQVNTFKSSAAAACPVRLWR